MSLAPPDVTASPPRDPRYQTLDAWRGLACLMITVGHASGTLELDDWKYFGDHPAARALRVVFGQCWLGVPLFFVISGYCIAATVDSAQRKGHGPAQYFFRRLRRIFPPYWIFLGMLAALSGVACWGGWSELLTQGDCRIPAPETLEWMQWLGNLTLTETWRSHIAVPPPGLLFFGPAWSLCYEEQFYAVCGLVLWLWPRRFWQGMIIVSLLTLLPASLNFRTDSYSRVAGWFFDGRWLVFAAGVGVFYSINIATPKQRRGFLVVLVLATSAAIDYRYRILAQATPAQKTMAFELVVAALFALTLLALQPWDRHLASSILLVPLKFCGRICYSLYMVHWPVTILASHLALVHGLTGVGPTLTVVVPLATALSIFLAWYFHQAVEKRFLNAR